MTAQIPRNELVTQEDGEPDLVVMRAAAVAAGWFPAGIVIVGCGMAWALAQLPGSDTGSYILAAASVGLAILGKLIERRVRYEISTERIIYRSFLGRTVELAWDSIEEVTLCSTASAAGMILSIEIRGAGGRLDMVHWLGNFGLGVERVLASADRHGVPIRVKGPRSRDDWNRFAQTRRQLEGAVPKAAVLPPKPNGPRGVPKPGPPDY